MRLLALSVLLLAAPAAAQNLNPLKVNYAVDAPVTAGGAVLWISSEAFFKHQLAPQTCRWCNPPGFDSSVRSALIWKDTSAANAISNVSAFAVMPLLALAGTSAAAFHDGADSKTITGDLLVISEAVVIAQDLNQAVKFAAGRERPFVHALPADQKALTPNPDDNNVSFFSGHTTWAFSLATAAGTVCSMHGYKATPYVWAAGLTLATATGVLRIGADKHYASDVLVGAALGSAIGIGVPRLLHPIGAPQSQQSVGLSAAPLPGGATLGMSGQF